MRMTILIMLTALALAPCAARADQELDPGSDVGFRGWGPRVGLSIDPDQIHFGAHLDFGNFARHVRFQPNIEVGVGDNVTLVTVNAEAAYRFLSRWDVWAPYVGGGLGANVVRFDKGNNSETDIGINALAGIERGLSHGDRFFLEAKFSLNDVPDAKFTAGWTFYH